MTSEEELKLAKEQQEKNDREQLEKELSEAGINSPCDDAPITMKAMIELFGFMRGKIVEDVYTRVINNQNAATSTSVSVADSLADKAKAKDVDKPPLNFSPPASYLTQAPPTQPHINNQSRPPPKLDNTRYFS